MNIRRMAGAIFVLALIFSSGTSVNAQSAEQNITITVRPAQTAEERVADQIKEQELRRDAEDKIAAERSSEIAEKSPKALLSHARTVFISSNTDYFEPVQLQNELRKRAEFDSWQMAIVDGWGNRDVADMIIEVDRPLFTFTYKITARETGILLAAGKVNAFDGNAAAPRLTDKIIAEIKKARGESKVKK